MYTVTRHFAKFNTDSAKDVTEYEEILNDPFCTIYAERIEKVREVTYNEETGMPTSSIETIWKLVTWDEKHLVT